MIAIWCPGNITLGSEFPDDVEFMPFRDSPPKGCPSLYVCETGEFEFTAGRELFYTDEYFDLAFPATDRNVKEFLQSVADWPDFPTWVAHRDTPQTRWLRRLQQITGHLGNAILKLMERGSIVIKVV